MNDTRANVIEKSVILEDVISKILCFLLDIEDYKKSLSFGGKSLSLSLNSKVNLLMDMELLPKDKKNDLQLFMEIRNKFAHLSYVDNFTTCLKCLDKDRKNKLLSKYPKESQDIEEEIKYDVCFSLLSFELRMFLEMSVKQIHHKKSQDLKKTGAVEVVREFLKVHSNINEIENAIRIKKYRSKTDVIIFMLNFQK